MKLVVGGKLTYEANRLRPPLNLSSDCNNISSSDATVKFSRQGNMHRGI
jgi:hypothetical protein